MRRFKSRHSKGISLIEILIVTAIIAVLIAAGIGMYMRQLSKARDSQRKRDLDRIKIAFADYYGDNDCFPGENTLVDCGGVGLQPYLKEIPCDPSNEQPYRLDIDVGSLCPSRYRVLTTLEVDTDPVIAQVHCDGDDGCGEGLENYNYGVSDGIPVGFGDILGGGDDGTNNPTSTPTGDPTSTPTGAPAPTSTPPGAPTSTPTNIPTSTPTPPGAPTSTPTNTPTPTPTTFAFPTPGGVDNFCCAGVCNVWDQISYCPAGVYDTLIGCISAPNGCSE